MFGLNREPALIVGASVSAATAAILSLVGDGLVTQDQGETIVNLLGALSPVIAGLLIRFKAYAPQTVADITGRDVNNLPPPP